MSSIISQWQEHIAHARANHHAIEIRGGGSKAFYGHSAVGDVLNTTAHSGIVSYEPTELVITAKGGTPLADIEAALAEKNQMLAFEPPHFGPATVGGCVAAGLAGPRRPRVGAVRDFVLGTQLLDGNGKLMDFGGQVMKNVAGYDVSRFLAGSLGMLGIITEVSLKVLPKPETEHSFALQLNQAEALTTLSQWAAQPLPISATAWFDNILLVRLSGANSAVSSAAATLTSSTTTATVLKAKMDADMAKGYWHQIKEQQNGFFSDGDTPLWRVAVPPTTAPLSLAEENTMLEWNGTQRWIRSQLNGQALRAEVEKLGGHATLFRGGDEQQGIFTPLSAGLLMLHKKLKSEFDPDAIFNPGRMYAGL